MNPSPKESPTLAACLTPAGTGAIAVLAIRGPKAWPVVRELFRHYSRPETPLPEQAELGRFWLGRIGEDSQAAKEEAVLSVQRLVPVPWVELHCHGGTEVVRWVLDILEARGLRTCSWQQLERMTNDDPVRALAAEALSQAPTARIAGILLDQYQGAFSQAIAAILTVLERNELAEATRLLEELARHGNVGRHLTVPWRVAVLGAPNVGKSSLVNALAGYQRSVVAATPGTTRDVVTAMIAVDGWPVELSDTAGLRDQAGFLEAEGIQRARTVAATADLCLWILDASAPPVWPDTPLPALKLVINKADLPAAWDLDQAEGAVHLSALTGMGIAELCQALAGWLVPEAPPPGAAVPFIPALWGKVEKAWQACVEGRYEETRQILFI